jgi:hypothetical protein
MNYAFNKIKFNKCCIGKEGRKKYSINKNYNKVISRPYSQQIPPNKTPFPSWKLIVIISGLGLYHQYVNQVKRY